MSKIEDLLNTGVSFIPAVVCFLIKDDKVLLIHRKKTSLGLGKNLIAGIGGKIGDHAGLEDETPEQALIRECEEEIRITPVKYSTAGRVRFIWLTKPEWNMDVSIFRVTEWNGTPTETEDSNPEWFPISSPPLYNMWEDNSYWVPQVLRGDIVNATYLYGPDKSVIEIK